MQIFRALQDIPAHFGPSVVTIGNFDGVHRGHRAVLADVIERARTLRARSVALTFDPHPARVLRPESSLRLIAPLDRKLALLAQTGVDVAVVLPFTPALSRTTAREFARRVLRDALGTIEIHEGENFRFGADARADVNKLAALGAEFGFGAHSHQPTLYRGTAVSSSTVRAAIAAGDMRAARRLLGRVFEVVSTPASGRGYGSRYTVPTINLAPYSELLPAHGVYTTCLEIHGEMFPSVTNVGDRPTFGADSFAVESYVLDFQPMELEASTTLTLKFFDRIRGEKKWPSPQALKERIAVDVAHARRYFALLGAAAPVSKQRYADADAR
ncbi:MAG: bifunctional riboflavin kinase/FMN adenylyltransferase [Acidobacteriaceae bacterium]